MSTQTINFTEKREAGKERRSDDINENMRTIRNHIKVSSHRQGSKVWALIPLSS